MSSESKKSAIYIRPANSWVALEFQEIIEYKDLIWYLTVRDIKARYRQTALGPLWIILQPIATMVVFSYLFGSIAKLSSGGWPYPIFAYSGLLPWNYFQTAISSSATSLVKYMPIISKVYFPRVLVPIVGAISGLIDFLFSFVVFVIMLFVYGIVPSVNFVFVPVFLFAATITALSIGLWTAALSVRFRDLATGLGFVVRAWMFFTPVVYSVENIPGNFLNLYKLNPMYWVVEGFRWSMLGEAVHFEPIALISFLGMIILLVFGFFVFRKTELTIVDWL